MTISSNEYERSQSVGYGSFLEQIFDRALTQLECAQPMRNKQPLPPRVDVKIS
jgi:hypothetical protein